MSTPHLPLLLVDECVYRVTSNFVRGLGYDVLTVQQAGLAGAKDEKVIQLSSELERVLLTRDSDFTNVLRYPPVNYPGIIVLKITPLVIPQVHYVLHQALLHVCDWQGALVIVDRNKYRVRY